MAGRGSLKVQKGNEPPPVSMQHMGTQVRLFPCVMSHESHVCRQWEMGGCVCVHCGGFKGAFGYT